MIFVVDASDAERLKLAKELLDKYTNYESLKTLPLAVMANKTDQDKCLSHDKLVKVLELDKMNSRPWKLFRTSGIFENGISETVAWLKTTAGVRVTMDNGTANTDEAGKGGSGDDKKEKAEPKM
eukprot:CAMPEP_0114575468 /NCGR_PEP_ID=MMETSP0125-20121206/332_1 /TAXON_ID=485358 ORGANISM="Aristerostoma sp., Strain ATCC 50986" /NCGR_SAMPLE_ID=MMETSP0125 /ASSEMBLY_ACC=CAM_ASM_000245 /LENGTH=123 /DNA_ID=CAMNT_0001763217 /DNA_START=291 /DNA_END=662 /DNA_ORIENTATION=-